MINEIAIFLHSFNIVNKTNKFSLQCIDSFIEILLSLGKGISKLGERIVIIQIKLPPEYRAYR